MRATDFCSRCRVGGVRADIAYPNASHSEAATEELPNPKNRLYFSRLKLKALYQFYAHSIRNSSSVPGAQFAHLQKV
jgi:hypothetical protein